MSADPPEPWPDDLQDSIALVEAQLADDIAGIACLLRHGNSFSQAVTLSKLLAEVVSEQNVSLPHFREWAAAAERRP